MKIISYYTKNTPYQAVAERFLIPSLEKFGLDSEVKEYEDKGSWGANTGIKSQFILETLLKYKEPVVFVDCDAEIVRPPTLLYQISEDVDIGYYHFNWYGHWRNQWENTTKIELLSGTMYFNYNEKVIGLLQEWIGKVQTNLNRWEQKVLEEIVYARTDLNIYKIPAEYCCVLKQDYSIPAYIKDPIIIHNQASRLFKRKQNWEENLKKFRLDK